MESQVTPCWKTLSTTFSIICYTIFQIGQLYKHKTFSLLKIAFFKGKPEPSSAAQSTDRVVVFITIW